MTAWADHFIRTARSVMCSEEPSQRLQEELRLSYQALDTQDHFNVATRLATYAPEQLVVLLRIIEGQEIT